jgi:heme/copper-type cytochrome/quinol oxidase subunit 2
MFMDVRVDPVSPVPWDGLIVLLVIVFVLAVGFTVALIALLIYLRRRKQNEPAID